jgi:hypothetical protein
MKKLLILASALLLLSVTAQSSFAHSGRTNAAGCHTNSKTGDYHCHNALTAQPPTVTPIVPNASATSDSQIAQILIRQSIAAYSGNCPCPYNRASNGSRCGGRSAYSRPGGASPLCYESDVTPQMIANYRRQSQ